MRTFEIELYKIRVEAPTRKAAQAIAVEAVRPMMMDAHGRPFPLVKGIVEIKTCG